MSTVDPGIDVATIAAENAALRQQLLDENEKLRAALTASQVAGLTFTGLTDEDVRKLEHPEEFVLAENDEFRARLAQLEAAVAQAQGTSTTSGAASIPSGARNPDGSLVTTAPDGSPLPGGSAIPAGSTVAANTTVAAADGSTVTVPAGTQIPAGATVPAGTVVSTPSGVPVTLPAAATVTAAQVTSEVSNLTDAELQAELDRRTAAGQ
jgi:hypothetical protein